MASDMFTFTSAKRGRIAGHEVVEYRLREGHDGIVHSVRPLLMERLEIATVPHGDGTRYRVTAHYGDDDATDFYINDKSILTLISDIREENGLSRL